jgi:hypothetical protein
MLGDFAAGLTGTVRGSRLEQNEVTKVFKCEVFPPWIDGGAHGCWKQQKACKLRCPACERHAPAATFLSCLPSIDVAYLSALQDIDTESEATLDTWSAPPSRAFPTGGCRA